MTAWPTWKGWVVVALVGMASLASAQAGELLAIEVLPQSPPESEHAFSGWRSEPSPPPTLEVPLELGDEIYGATLRLHPLGSGGRYRVRVQYETSLSLAAAGPHIDLVDWKHCHSEWVDAPASSALEFVLPVPTPEQQDCFPDYTRSELGEAVHGQLQDPELADAWLADLDRSEQVIGVDASAGISRVRVKVEALRDGAWKEVAMVTFLPPMGC